jgi:hypothetical protein
VQPANLAIFSAFASLQPLLTASKRQQAAIDGWAHILRSDPTAHAQLEAALRPLLTEEVQRAFGITLHPSRAFAPALRFHTCFPLNFLRLSSAECLSSS